MTIRAQPKKKFIFLIEIFYDLNNRSSFPPPATASHPRLLMNSRRNPPPSCTEEESLASGEKTKQKLGHAVYLNGEPGRRWFFTWMSTACSPTAVAVKETLTPAGALCTWTGMLRWLTPAQMTQKKAEIGAKTVEIISKNWEVFVVTDPLTCDFNVDISGFYIA